MSISEFKATCLAVLKRVNRTGRPLLITRFGEPVAEVIPPRPETHGGGGWLGALSGHGSITGDIVGPAVPPEDWDALSG